MSDWEAIARYKQRKAERAEAKSNQRSDEEVAKLVERAKFYQRRKDRLDAKDPIIQFYQRRAERLNWRADDEDEGGNNKPKGGGGSHGNTRLPYGLAKGEGVETKGMTPKEVWEALAGKGYSASEAYKGLKEGKSGKELKSKKSETVRAKATTKLSLDMFPDAMSGKSVKGTTSRYIEAINEYGGDEDAVQFVSSIARMPIPYGFQMKRSTVGDECFLSYRPRGLDATLKVPELKKGLPSHIRKSKTASFVHEVTHLLNHGVNKGTFDAFTDKAPELRAAIDKERNNAFSKAANDEFEVYKQERDKLVAEANERKKEVPQRAVDELFGGKRPKWLKEDFTVDYWAFSYSDDSEDLKKFRKLRDKYIKEIEQQNSQERRALRDGCTNLQGLYDSVTRGGMRKKGFYGHSETYFKRDPYADANELLSDYVALAIVNPRLLSIFENDFPETSRELRKTMKQIMNKMGV